jgi:4-hydroxybenzoyl-CoA thioesterase
MTDGDSVKIDITVKEWGRKTVSLEYEGTVGGVAVFQAQEVRGLFKRNNGDTFAMEIAALRELVEAFGKE